MTKIIFSPQVALQLMGYDKFCTGMEFSGVGFVDITPEKDFLVYEFVMMDIGTEGWTEIDPAKMSMLATRSDVSHMKIWIH